LETSSGCSKDSVAVHDGADDTAALLANGLLCGSQTSLVLFSSTPDMMIEFKSDMAAQSTGFSLNVDLCELL